MIKGIDEFAKSVIEELNSYFETDIEFKPWGLEDYFYEGSDNNLYFIIPTSDVDSFIDTILDNELENILYDLPVSVQRYFSIEQWKSDNYKGVIDILEEITDNRWKLAYQGKEVFVYERQD